MGLVSFRNFQFEFPRNRSRVAVRLEPKVESLKVERKKGKANFRAAVFNIDKSKYTAKYERTPFVTAPFDLRGRC